MALCQSTSCRLHRHRWSHRTRPTNSSQPLFILDAHESAQKIEGILAAQSNDDNFMAALNDFDGYYLPLVQDSNGQNHVALAPDHQQRALVAVFTAEDAAQRFMQAATEKLNNSTNGYRHR